MEDNLLPLYKERENHPHTLGIILVEKNPHAISFTENFDVILLIIVKEQKRSHYIEHYVYHHKKVALHIIKESQLHKWMLLGSNRKVIEWIDDGKILFEQNQYMNKLKKEMRNFSFYGRKLKMGIEFAKLIKRYLDGKAFFTNGQYLDAYNHVVHSLHHLARLAIIKNGHFPEITVWNQVKKIEPEIHKLYEELVNSEEGLEKRLELLFLASDFLIHSYIEYGTSHLIDIIVEKEKWSMNDLLTHPELQYYGIDLPMLLAYLKEKKMLEVIKSTETKNGFYQYYYKVTK